jgi:hypothetical protein
MEQRFAGDLADARRDFGIEINNVVVAFGRNIECKSLDGHEVPESSCSLFACLARFTVRDGASQIQSHEQAGHAHPRKEGILGTP